MIESKEERKDVLCCKATMCADDALRCVQEVRDAFISDSEKHGIESTMEVIGSFSVEEVTEIESCLTSVLKQMNTLKEEIRDLFYESRKDLF